MIVLGTETKPSEPDKKAFKDRNQEAPYHKPVTNDNLVNVNIPQKSLGLIKIIVKIPNSTRLLFLHISCVH